MKISVKKSKSRECQTACQDYSPDMKEFIFAIKGRPFAMLSTPKLPVPPVSLIDFNLVRDLGLEMHDLQCTKYTFGGVKLRILGRISQTLQTIQDGAISGTAHVRANVVENLYQVFDTHSVAGQQMISSLTDSPARQEAASPSDVSREESSPRHRSQPEQERQVPQAQTTPDPPRAQPAPVKKTISVTGEERIAFPDGTIVTVLTDGTRRLEMPNGQLEEHTSQYKRRTYPDGTVKTLHTDGRQETR